jgi:hypothetical protein
VNPFLKSIQPCAKPVLHLTTTVAIAKEAKHAKAERARLVRIMGG